MKKYAIIASILILLAGCSASVSMADTNPITITKQVEKNPTFLQKVVNKQLKHNRQPKVMKRYALSLLRQHGFGYPQFSCLNTLWIRESNWRWNAKNKSSGAYGIPQSLPANKMAKAGPDWKTNPHTQIRWGIDYIIHRYGTPCSALSYSNKHGWY